MSIIIREGIPEDIPSVFLLIKELAEYERAAEEVIITDKIMYEDAFGTDPAFRFIVALENDVIVGTAVYFFTYSTWKGRAMHLEDIVVSENMRRKGIGKLMFDWLVKTAYNIGSKRFTWQVLEWNTPAIGFYKKINAQLDAEWINCKFSTKGLKNYVDLYQL
ncbi:MAG: GNAT family N-acetyltransferase [Saprospiraceae bacterium]|nr:GNAT family N-acetyltransferase [Saprospiraceae bacterium]